LARIFISAGGCAFRMLQNMTEMLAPDGRLFLFASSNSFPTAYVKVSPDWIMDYFAIQRICRLQGLSYGIPASGR
jgi:hypothetical protein